MRSAYCAASVRSCMAETRVRPTRRAVRRGARAPAADGRCPAPRWARRGARFALLARGQATTARWRSPPLSVSSRRSRSSSRSRQASARAAISRSRAPSRSGPRWGVRPRRTLRDRHPGRRVRRLWNDGDEHRELCARQLGARAAVERDRAGEGNQACGGAGGWSSRRRWARSAPARSPSGQPRPRRRQALHRASR